ncbi:ATP-binding protein [Nonomuraea angiospora]|uniref:ATP-binding protein n=1 Tax=Nonomuraea angiospora TaxID=46172 RepID=UPI0033C8FCB5
MIYDISPSELQAIGTIRLARDGRAPSRARQSVSVWLEPDHPALEIAVLAASELVTNAVRYAGPGGGTETITLELHQGRDYLRLVVTDPGSSCSTPSRIPLQAPSLDAERGRGLAIVEALSRNRWGSHRVPPDGLRLVWCHLDLNPTPAQVEELFRSPM